MRNQILLKIVMQVKLYLKIQQILLSLSQMINQEEIINKNQKPQQNSSVINQ